MTDVDDLEIRQAERALEAALSSSDPVAWVDTTRTMRSSRHRAPPPSGVAQRFRRWRAPCGRCRR
jgi:hypothetical protein